MPRKPMTETQYVALAGSRRDLSGFWIVSVGEPGESKEGVYNRALDQLVKLYGMGGPPEEVAEIFHLHVVTLPQARRAFPRAWSHWQFAIRAGIPY